MAVTPKQPNLVDILSHLRISYRPLKFHPAEILAPQVSDLDSIVEIYVKFTLPSYVMVLMVEA